MTFRRIACGAPGQDEELSAAEEEGLLRRGISAALAQLDPRERFIVEQRVLRETPMTLNELGGSYELGAGVGAALEVFANAGVTVGA